MKIQLLGELVPRNKDEEKRRLKVATNRAYTLLGLYRVHQIYTGGFVWGMWFGATVALIVASVVDGKWPLVAFLCIYTIAMLWMINVTAKHAYRFQDKLPEGVFQEDGEWIVNINTDENAEEWRGEAPPD
jgi:hypothetical protein